MSLAKIIEKFADARVLLVGDSIVDLYTYGTAIGLAAETPTIAARQEKVQARSAATCSSLVPRSASSPWRATMRQHGTFGRSSTPGWN